MDGYLSKAIDPAMLFAVVERADDGGVMQQAVAEPVTFDEGALRARLSGDHDLMTDVIRVFLEDLPMRLAAIKSAVTGRDAEALRVAAHAAQRGRRQPVGRRIVRSGARARAARRRLADGRRGGRVAAVVGRSQ